MDEQLAVKIKEYLRTTTQQRPDVISIAAHLSSVPPGHVAKTVRNLVDRGEIIRHNGGRFMAGSWYSVEKE